MDVSVSRTWTLQTQTSILQRSSLSKKSRFQGSSRGDPSKAGKNRAAAKVNRPVVCLVGAPPPPLSSAFECTAGSLSLFALLIRFFIFSPLVGWILVFLCSSFGTVHDWCFWRRSIVSMSMIEVQATSHNASDTSFLSFDPMSRPQIGIDRLPQRRMSTEPRESMNCKSCRKRKVCLSIGHCSLNSVTDAVVIDQVQPITSCV